MKNALLVVALAFVSFIVVTLFSSNDSNAQVFALILLILLFLLEKQAPTGNTVRRNKNKLEKTR